MTAFVTGVRHIKIWVTDLARSRGWYERVFELEHVLSFEDSDGVVRGMAFRVPGAPFELALRENPGLAASLDDADPFALATTRPSLDAWIERLDSLGIAHSGILEGSRGFVLGFRDPDRLQIRLYAEDAELAARVGEVVRDVHGSGRGQAAQDRSGLS